jgi:hypothetical protein
MTTDTPQTVSMVAPGDMPGAAVVALCQHCGGNLVTSGRGRPARFCGPRCRQAARRATSQTPPVEGVSRAGRAGRRLEPGARRGVPGDRAGDTDFRDTPGLVICAISGRPAEPEPSDLEVPALWQPSFPDAVALTAVAEMLPSRAPWAGEEGPRPRIVISPGAIALERPDLAKRERTAERARKAHGINVDVLAAQLGEDGQFPPAPPVRQRIHAWSRKSRSNMCRKLCELDYAPLFADPKRMPALLTLTYSEQWEVIVPDGSVFKSHLWAFRRRWLRAWGEPLRGPWKQEFQRRGAPHAHILTVPPHGHARSALDRWGHPVVGAGMTFRRWLSAVWADVVDCPAQTRENFRRNLAAGTNIDFAEGLRASDPKRVAVYFTKHGSFASKEYQNRVPAAWSEPGKGPGRFWGVWGLRPATRIVELEPAIHLQAARIARRWARAQGTTREVRVPRGIDVTTGRLTLRRVRRRVTRMPNGVGWVSVNDGATFTAQLARALTA